MNELPMFLVQGTMSIRTSIITLSFIVFTHPDLTAQEKMPSDVYRSIEIEVLSQPGTDKEVLGRARAALLEAVVSMQLTKAEQNLQFIDALFPTTT